METHTLCAWLYHESSFQYTCFVTAVIKLRKKYIHSPFLSAIGAAAWFVVDLESAHGETRHYFSCVRRPFFSHNTCKCHEWKNGQDGKKSLNFSVSK